MTRSTRTTADHSRERQGDHGGAIAQVGVVQEVKVAVGDRVSEGSVILTLEAGDVQVPGSPRRRACRKATWSRRPAGTGTDPAAPADIGAGCAIRQVPRRCWRGPHPRPRPLRPRFRRSPHPRSTRQRSPGRTPALDPPVRSRTRRRSGKDSRLGPEGPHSARGRAGVRQRRDVTAAGDRAGTRSRSTGRRACRRRDAEIDFSQFGEIETRALTKIKKLSGAGLHRNWVTIPHVTHQEEADITELEAFRKEMSERRSRTSG